MRRSFFGFKGFFFFALLMASQSTFSQVLTNLSDVNDRPNVQFWPDRIWEGLSREVDRSGTQVTNVLFDLVDDLDIFSKTEGNNSGSVHIRRTVFDNQDILGTYTVSDEFSLSIAREGTEFSIPLFPSVLSPLNFNLGVGGKLSVNHLRQVLSKDIAEIPEISVLDEEVTQELRGEGTEAREITPWWEIDSSVRPRFGQFWNPLVSVYRIPWTKEGLRKLKDGDLISYSASGFLSVGLEAGFIPLKLADGVELSLGVGVQTFVKGEFRITVLKENERFVRVKVTKVKSIGYGGVAGATTNEMKFFEGVMLFEGKTLETDLSQTLEVIPFKIGIEKENKTQFDLGYRFDLEDPDAELAYEKAVKGNFKYAADLSATNSAVTHLLTREAREKRLTSAFQLGANWAIKLDQGRERKNLVVTITKPDGTRELFKNSYQLSNGWTAIWGSGEKKNFLFTTVFDATSFKKGEKDSFQLVSEAFYEDVRTSGPEMESYINDIESVIGKEDVLPELPILVPRSNILGFKKAKYQRTSFYFGQFFTEEHVTRFIMTDKLKAWDITYQSFDYVQDVLTRATKVEKFYKHWMNMQAKFVAVTNSDEMNEVLQELRSIFRYHNKAIHAMRVILLSLPGVEVDYFLTGSNASFGRIQFRGRVSTNAERLLQMADETTEFENRVVSARFDQLAQIEDLVVVPVSNKELKVSFVLPKDINYIFFKVLRSSGWKRMKILKEFIYANRVRFKEGKNEWIARTDSKDPLDQMILECFKTTDFYTLQMSASAKKQSWGRVVSSRFKVLVSDSELP